MKYTAIAFTVLFVLHNTCSASTVLFSTLNQPLSSFNGFDSTGTRYQATDFLTGDLAMSLSSATANLYNADDRTHSMVAYIYSNSAFDTPDSVIGTFDSTVSLPVGVVAGNISNASNFTFTDSGITLSPNTKYWLVLESLDSNHVNAVHWTATTSGIPDSGSTFSMISATNNKYSLASGGPWTNTLNGDFRISLSGTAVPEPHRVLLMISGLASLLSRRRR